MGLFFDCIQFHMTFPLTTSNIETAPEVTHATNITR